MDMTKRAWLEIPAGVRCICVSDIHGELALFKKLLDKMGFCEADILILLGDLYLKGSEPDATLEYIVDLAKRPNVHVLRGNCDWRHDKHQEWLDDLPMIIESDDYVFVHGSPEDVRENAFMEGAGLQEKWTVAGHWPVNNYCHEIACVNPIINREKRIIAIDGGCINAPGGQLNGFVIRDGKFSFDSVDRFPMAVATHRQKEAKGTLNITWNDRFVTVVKRRPEFSVVRHNASGIEIEVPTACLRKDEEGAMWCESLTNHRPAVRPGDAVAVVASFSDRHYIKKDGILGWIGLEVIE